MSNDWFSQIKCFARTEPLHTSGETSTTLAAALQQARIVGKSGHRLEPFAERPWDRAFVWAIVIALMFFARPNFPIIQMPQ
jgi:hypothetical protein